MKTSNWTTALTSALWGNKTLGGTNKIRVHPVSLGSNQPPLEFWSSFYALGCLVAYAKVHRDGALNERFDFGRITPIPASKIPNLLDKLPNDPGIFLRLIGKAHADGWFSSK